MNQGDQASPVTEIGEGVEAVARALCEARGWNPDALGYAYEPARLEGGRGFFLGRDEAVPVWHLYALDARAAIQAMARATHEIMKRTA